MIFIFLLLLDMKPQVIITYLDQEPLTIKEFDS